MQKQGSMIAKTHQYMKEIFNEAGNAKTKLIMSEIEKLEIKNKALLNDNN